MRLASQTPREDTRLAELVGEVQKASAKEKETKAEMIILQVGFEMAKVQILKPINNILL